MADEWTHEGVAEFDDLPLEEKRKMVDDIDAFPNTVCGVCGNICCYSCTAGGNPQSCAETMFRECRKCGHASSAHHPG